MNADRRFPLASTLMAVIALSCISGASGRVPCSPATKLLARAWADFPVKRFRRRAIEFHQVFDQSQEDGATFSALEAEYGLGDNCETGDDADPAKATSLL